MLKTTASVDSRWINILALHRSPIIGKSEVSSLDVVFKSSSVSPPSPPLCVHYISLISPNVVKPTEIVVGDVWLYQAPERLSFSALYIYLTVHRPTAPPHMFHSSSQPQRCSQGSIVTIGIHRLYNNPPSCNHPVRPSKLVMCCRFTL